MASGDTIFKVTNLTMNIYDGPGSLEFWIQGANDITPAVWPAGITTSGTSVNFGQVSINFNFADSTDTPAIGIDPTAKYTVTMTQD